MSKSDNPYFIKSGPAAIAFSGGRTSAYMLAKILEACDGKLPPDVVVTFQNTGEEVEQTYEFIHEIETRWVPVLWLEYCDEFRSEDYQNADGGFNKNRRRRDLSDPSDRGYREVNFVTAAREGEPFDAMLTYYWTYRALVKDEGPILPNRVARMCTANLKIKTQTRYMQSHGYKFFDAYAGIRYDEPRRWAKLAATNDRADPQTVIYPMVSAQITRQDVLNFWSTQPFDLQLDPLAEEGNCRLCFLKKTDRIIRIIRKLIIANGGEPDAEVERWLRREREGGMTFRNDRPSVEKLVQIAMSPAEIIPTPDEQEIDCICGSPSV